MITVSGHMRPAVLHTAADENRLEELIMEVQTALPVELPDPAKQCASTQDRLLSKRHWGSEAVA
ncbi:hypothetical protein [Streptomyces mirabilis]|uniref:hypothetical protein n=1 Tax=Streptomyces mirabilis TaxID=68239 RepID=UPI003F4CB3BE